MSLACDPCYLLLLVLCGVRLWLHIMSGNWEFTIIITTSIQKEQYARFWHCEKDEAKCSSYSIVAFTRKIKCSEILNCGSPEDIVKLPSETEHIKDHNRKQGSWQIQSNFVKKVARVIQGGMWRWQLKISMRDTTADDAEHWPSSAIFVLTLHDMSVIFIGENDRLHNRQCVNQT